MRRLRHAADISPPLTPLPLIHGYAAPSRHALCFHAAAAITLPPPYARCRLTPRHSRGAAITMRRKISLLYPRLFFAAVSLMLVYCHAMPLMLRDAAFHFRLPLTALPLPAPLLMLIATTRWLCAPPPLRCCAACRHAMPLPPCHFAIYGCCCRYGDASDAAAERALPACQARAADACHAAFCCAAMPYCIILMLRYCAYRHVDAAAAIFFRRHAYHHADAASAAPSSAIADTLMLPLCRCYAAAAIIAAIRHLPLLYFRFFADSPLRHAAFTPCCRRRP
jgi:hypothetical protein